MYVSLDNSAINSTNPQINCFPQNKCASFRSKKYILGFKLQLRNRMSVRKLTDSEFTAELCAHITSIPTLNCSMRRRCRSIAWIYTGKNQSSVNSQVMDIPI